jgi:hypothetical protein
MADWTLAQRDPADALTRLHYFTMKKQRVTVPSSS